MLRPSGTHQCNPKSSNFFSIKTRKISQKPTSKEGILSEGQKTDAATEGQTIAATLQRIHSHGETFSNLSKSNPNQIVFTMHRLIWNSKQTLSVCCSKSMRNMVNTIWFGFNCCDLGKISPCSAPIYLSTSFFIYRTRSLERSARNLFAKSNAISIVILLFRLTCHYKSLPICIWRSSR